MRKNECFIHRLKIFRKSSIVFLLLAMLSLSITGCGSSKTAVTSSDDPSLRCKEIKDFSKDNDFWDYAYKNIPTISYSEIEGGEYDNSYVCVDAIVLYSHELAGSYDLLLAFNLNDNDYTDQSFMPDATGNGSCKYGYKLIPDLSAGTSVKICSYVSKGRLNYYLTGIEKTNLKNTLDTSQYMKDRNEKMESERDDYLAQITETPQSDNPLMNADLNTGTVYSGDKSKVLGSYGYINISKAVLKNITEEQFEEFAQEKVKDNPWYNWVSIICEDGTGICFSGSDIYYPSYGKLDTDGAITDGYGDITWDFDANSYTYTPRQ